jgi:hypothetical protein
MSVDDGIFYQPVQAYFQFINEGNINLFRQEAAERHSQIMEQMVQQLCQDYENRSLNVEQMCVNEPAQQRADADARHEQIASELAGYMMSRTVAEQEVLNLRKELSEANAKLENAANAVALEANQKGQRFVTSPVHTKADIQILNSRLTLKLTVRKL